MNSPLALTDELVLSNRVMKSASSSGFFTSDHYPTERCLQLYIRIARSRPGLMVLEDAFVDALGEYGHAQLSLASDAALAAHKRLLDAIRSVSPSTKVFAQLGHAGDKGSLPINSATLEQLDALPALYLAAVERARRAGYDGAQLHAGHTNLLSRSMSAAFNCRTDRFGPGTALLDSVLNALRGVAADFPISLKLQADEFMPQHGGITAEQTVCTITHLSFPFCFIELCGGTTDSRSAFMATVNQKQNYYYRHVVHALKAANQLHRFNFAVTGGMRDMQTAELALADGCDLVGFCRQFLRDEGFISLCTRCNRCSDNLTHSPSGLCILRDAP